MKLHETKFDVTERKIVGRISREYLASCSTYDARYTGGKYCTVNIATHILIPVDLARFRKKFSVCATSQQTTNLIKMNLIMNLIKKK